ncbi:carboxymuconolactone decarboxylase family protein [Hoyosella altamirensis]|uniref:AhpD family alkylhydroperoxidase n=1 Tax=Hoyosella altamirensis TaxID=616997 RepID=A0A839RKN6_9ACTN|nr:carboxymuconolactone decarboxylase family protein [Hoyosella altamirensis]MBB3036788.1 AhpD family alkylhydroperoxidase [Hoyosella altamirensis]
MRALRRIWNYLVVLRLARRNKSDLARWMIRRPQLLAATGLYETSLLFSNRVDPALKELAELKVATLVTCEFCLDIGSALALKSGLTEQQITELPRYQTSPAYTELEKLVIEYAEVLTATPVVEKEELRKRLLQHLSRAQLAELAATIAWENQRARLNQGLGVRATGMSDGAACALPDR